MRGKAPTSARNKYTGMPVMRDPSASTVLRMELLRKLGRKGEHEDAIKESINAVFRSAKPFTMSAETRATILLTSACALLVAGAFIRKWRAMAASRVVESLILTIGDVSLTLQDAAELDTLP